MVLGSKGRVSPFVPILYLETLLSLVMVNSNLIKASYAPYKSIHSRKLAAGP